jgi:hypothetical protein
MRVLKASVLMGPLLLLTGCLSIYDVRQGQNKVAGVPFYSKTAHCRHKTIWLEPVYTLSLQAQRLPAVPGQPLPPPEGVATVSLGQTAYGEIKANQALPNLIQKLTTDQLSLDDALQRFNALTAGLAQPLKGRRPDDFLLAGNARMADAVVDYSRAYTYNVRRPWAGTTSATLKLNSDGTLGEATAEIEDKTLETFASLIPLKEFLTAEFVDAAAAADAEAMLEGEESARAGQPFRIILTVQTTIFRHTLSKVEDLDGAVCKPPTSSLGPDPTGYEFQLEELKEPAAPKGEKGKKIDISGQIVLPEEEKPSS